MLKSSIAALAVLLSAAFHSESRAPGIVSDSTLPVVRFETYDFAFRGPATAHAGFTRIRVLNRGSSAHHVVLTRVPDTASADWVMKVISGKLPPAPVKDVGGPNMTLPHDSSEAVVELKPGRYSVTCWVTAADGKPHVMKGMLAMLEVSRSPAAVTREPKADLVLQAREFKLEFTTPPTRGKHLVKFANVGVQDHDVEIVRLAAGQTPAQLLKWAAAGLIGSPPVGTIVGGISGVDNPNRGWFPLDLVPGRYAMFCFVPDTKDNKPHILHGMLTEFTVR